MKEFVMINEALGKEIIQWAAQYLADHQQSIILHYKCVADTAYSNVYRLETTTGIFYLKHVPAALFIESKVLAIKCARVFPLACQQKTRRSY
jgi:hypothetical protein